MRYLLDTNVCIAIINGKSLHIEARLVKEMNVNSQMFVSSVSAFELWYGVAKSVRQLGNAQRLTKFFASRVHHLPFDEEDGRSAGEIRAELESVGRLVGEYDLLIAGQALRHKMTLVTANTREFAQIRTLSWEDWSKG